MTNHKVNNTSSGTETVRKGFSKRLLWGIGVTCLFLIAYVTYVLLIKPKPVPPPVILDILKSQGYTVNLGFSGNYAPGNILQTKELGPDGKERPLASPVVALWADQCFPGKKFRRNVFVLPESSGTSSAALNIGGQTLGNLLPSLAVISSAAADYRLHLGNPQVEAFAKLDLSEQLAEPCVKALARELKAGARAEWFSVVQEAIVVESLKFEIHWKTGTSVETRRKLKSTIESTVSEIAASDKGRERRSGGLSLEIDTETTTVMSAQVPVVVGYRTRPLEAVYAGAMKAEGKK